MLLNGISDYIARESHKLVDNLVIQNSTPQADDRATRHRAKDQRDKKGIHHQYHESRECHQLIRPLYLEEEESAIGSKTEAGKTTAHPSST